MTSGGSRTKFANQWHFVTSEDFRVHRLNMSVSCVDTAHKWQRTHTVQITSRTHYFSTYLFSIYWNFMQGIFIVTYLLSSDIVVVSNARERLLPHGRGETPCCCCWSVTLERHGGSIMTRHLFVIPVSIESPQDEQLKISRIFEFQS